MFLYNKHTQYTYWILLLVWLIISMHVAYRYVLFSSETEQGKGGTFVEATTQKVNYLPYVTNNDADKFYQSFIFNGCIYPSFSGTTISYREELCTVSTENYKSFTIQTVDNKYRSDGIPVSLNDIYFTYNTLLKDNYRSIGALDSYNNISVIANEQEETVEVIFPKASVDNMIFFTNFILPSHLLANQALETYVSTFYTSPIGTNCGKLAETKNDNDSVVFDLSTCSDVPLKFYQVKQFNDQTSLDEYVSSKNNTIDLIIGNAGYTGYDTNNVILNTFSTLFFNTKSPLLDAPTRKLLGSEIATYMDTTNILDPYLVQDHYLFNRFVSATSGTNLTSLLEKSPASDKEKNAQLVILPQVVRRGPSTTENQEYSITKEIEDKKNIKFVFEAAFDKISVSFNEGIEYFPESYSPKEKTSYYNLNPIYRNIIPGRNVYTIKGYENGIHSKTYTLVVHYLSEPTYPQEETVISDTEDYQPLSIIYYDDVTSNAIATALQTMFSVNNLEDFFIFERYEDPDVFAGKIQSEDYDVVISSVSMGLRKDISNLFLTDNPTINPSLYTNEELVLAINERFLFAPEARSASKEKINTIYGDDMPFVILGKELGNIHIRDTLAFPYPLRMYVLGRRKDFIKDLPVFQHFRINWARIREKSNFQDFLRRGGSTDTDT